MAGAELYLNSANASQQTPTAILKSDKRIRIGVAGGVFGAQFQWHEHPNCTVEAVTDLIPERLENLAQVYRCSKTYPSLEEMVRDPNLDAIGVFTGAPDHLRHSLLCLNAGKHVICAVPCGVNLEECEALLEAVRRTGLHYMMAETLWYHQSVITARQWFDEGKFGRIYYSESEYFHPGIESYFINPDGSRNWRYGFPPMKYATHCTAPVVGVTGESFTSVTCTAWGDDSDYLKENVYGNRFCNATAMFHTDEGNALRAAVWWKGPVGLVERAEWYGEKMSFCDPHINGIGAIVRRDTEAILKSDPAPVRKIIKFEKFDQPAHWQTDMLPAPLRHPSGHDCSHPFLTNEFVEALVQDRHPAIDIYAALAMTVPGIIAHESALQGAIQMKIPVYVRPV